MHFAKILLIVIKSHTANERGRCACNGIPRERKSVACMVTVEEDQTFLLLFFIISFHRPRHSDSHPMKEGCVKIFRTEDLSPANWSAVSAESIVVAICTSLRSVLVVLIYAVDGKCAILLCGHLRHFSLLHFFSNEKKVTRGFYHYKFNPYKELHISVAL